MGEARGQGWRAASKVVTPSEGKYEALYCSSMEMHRQSREIAHQQMQEMSDELSKKDEENQRLSEENKRLLDRCISLAEGVESLRELLKECQVYVEGMSSVDSELCDRVEREVSDESQ